MRNNLSDDGDIARNQEFFVLKIFPHIILILCYTILDATKKICP